MDVAASGRLERPSLSVFPLFAALETRRAAPVPRDVSPEMPTLRHTTRTSGAGLLEYSGIPREEERPPGKGGRERCSGGSTVWIRPRVGGAPLSPGFPWRGGLFAVIETPVAGIFHLSPSILNLNI